MPPKSKTHQKGKTAKKTHSPKSETAKKTHSPKSETAKKTHSPGGTTPERQAAVAEYRKADGMDLVSQAESDALAARVEKERKRLEELYPENYRHSGGSKTGKRKSRRNKNKTQRRK